MLRTSSAIALVLAVSAGPAFAAAQWTFADIDEDGNLELTEREFEPVSRDLFAMLDADDDDALAEDELLAGEKLFLTEGEVEFATWDADVGGAVDWAEFHDRLFDMYAADDEAIAEPEFAGLSEAVPAERAALEMPGEPGAIEAGEIIALPEWRYDELYTAGFSVEEFIDDVEVLGPTGEEIGDIEDMIFGSGGEVLAVVAEVGGFLDIGDTHVSIPWEEVTIEEGRAILPVTQETIEDYSLVEAEYLTAPEVATDVVTGVDDAATGPRAWRATELIGDYARLDDNDGFINYGYINDMIVRDGQLAAVLVDPDVTWGAAGPYAYPFYGYEYGWEPGLPYYDLPYTRDEVAELERFEVDRLED